MSHTLYEATDAPEAELGSHSYPPPSGPAQETQGEPKFIDGSGPIFSIYLEMAEEEDKKMVEGWKADADGILIFTGLFSAAVASLISVSIQDIRPNPQDTSNFYLANIYRTVSDTNRFNISSSLPTSPPEFSPPTYAVWVNSLWFLSLAISLTCALLATLLQQWARRYLKVTQPRYSLHKRARIRAFFSEGVEKFFLPWSVEVLPTLLHASLFLFFAGLVVFLFNANFTIFKLVVSWVGICATLYGYITFMPLFRHDSPYCTPLSSSAWYIVTGASCITFRALQRLASLVNLRYEAYNRFQDLEIRCHRLFAQGMLKTAEETALNSPSEFDTRAFVWTFDSLDEDHELERFFAGLPDFRSSQVVNDPLPSLTYDQSWRFSTTLTRFLDRTFSSDLLPEPIKIRRAIVCAKAIDPADIPTAFSVLDTIFSKCQCRGPLCAEVLQIMKGWGNVNDEGTSLLAQAADLSIVARTQQRDASWFSLASNRLGVAEPVLQDYAAHGDSLSLAVLTHITRQQFSHFRDPSWPSVEFSSVLEAASNFNVQNTSHELQREFCSLWNQIVRTAQNDEDRLVTFCILRCIRNVYIALHQDTDAAPTQFSASTGDLDRVLFEPSSYPLCDIPCAHDLDSTPASPTFSHTVPHDDDASDDALLTTSPSPTSSPDSSSLSASLHVDENPEDSDVQPLDNNVAIPVSSNPARQTSIERHPVPVASSDPAAAGATQRGVDACAGMTPHSTPATSTSPDPSISVVSPQHNADFPDTPDFSSSVSHNPVLDTVIPTATATHGAFSGSISAPDLGAAAEGDGSMRAALQTETDALYPPSLMRENTISTQELPSQLPSLPSVADAAIAGPSWRSLDAERTGDHPSHPSHGQYDIV